MLNHKGGVAADLTVTVLGEGDGNNVMEPKGTRYQRMILFSKFESLHHSEDARTEMFCFINCQDGPSRLQMSAKK